MVSCNQSQIQYIELTILFSDCSLKFNTMQSAIYPSIASTLQFSKFVSSLEYDFISNWDMSSKFCGYLFHPDLSKLSDSQKSACDNFTFNLMSPQFIMAETVDEKGDFIYLISRCTTYPMGSFSAQPPFGLHRFSFEELWGNCKAISLMKSLHAGNMMVSKQLLNLKEYFLMYRQHFSNWSMALFSKEMMYDELYKELKARKKKEKVKNDEIDPHVCVNCFKTAKNIVFLPCGHICVCKECALNELGLELCKIFYKKANTSNCLTCRKPIKEAREVFL